LGFYLVGYGCTTCIGNSGPLPEPIAKVIAEKDLVVSAVLSGNRNFEGRIHPQVKAAYLASPPLVVAYALAGRMDMDLVTEPIGSSSDGRPVYLKDIWPSAWEIQDIIDKNLSRQVFSKQYANVYEGDDQWKSLAVAAGELYRWEPESTYVKHPPYFEKLSAPSPQPSPSGRGQGEGLIDVKGARVLAVLGDSVTTDHISP